MIDTLIKYNCLQVYKVINDEYLTGMHCNVFYKELPVYSDFYTLFKGKVDGSVYTGADTIIDSIAVSLTPTLNYERAISIARKQVSFDATCISYRLGIYNANVLSSVLPKDYKLVWKIQGNEGLSYVIIDAGNEKVYSKDDGIRF